MSYLLSLSDANLFPQVLSQIMVEPMTPDEETYDYGDGKKMFLNNLKTQKCLLILRIQMLFGSCSHIVLCFGEYDFPHAQSLQF